LNIRVRPLIPNRPPSLLLESINVDDPYEFSAAFDIRLDSPACDGHFPGFPIVPGLIVVEAMAQTAAAGVRAVVAPSWVPVFVGVDRTRFRQPVLAPAELGLRVRLRQFSRSTGRLRFSGRATIMGDDSPAVSAELHFLATPDEALVRIWRGLFPDTT